MNSPEVFIVVAAFVLAGTVHAAAGFGSALVAVPILSLAIGVRVAAPVEAILALVISAAVLYQNWHALRWHEARPLIFGALLGTPLGTIGLKSLPPALITGCLAIILLGYGVFELATGRKETSALSGPAPTGAAPRGIVPVLSWFVGLCSGILGGAYATNGPPLIVYGSLRQWPKAAFKSILQSCFLVGGVFIVVCHAAGGLINREVLWYCLWGLPGVLAGMFLGSHLDRRLDPARFRNMVLALILILGASLLVRSILAR